MEYTFTQEQIENQINVVELSEDEVVIYGETLSGSGKHYVLTGRAVIDGETYHNFPIEFELKKESDDPNEIMAADWEWYDYML